MWWFTLIFTVGAGAASIYGVLPSLMAKSASVVTIPGESNLERAIAMAKMEGVSLTTPSAAEVIAKFFVRPSLSYPLDESAANVALVSVSPFQPSRFKFTFDAGDCRFHGHALAFDPHSNRAEIIITSISCIDNAKRVFTLTAENIGREHLGRIVSIDTPTESSLQVRNDGKSSSVPMFSNALIKFEPAIEAIPMVGETTQRF